MAAGPCSPAGGIRGRPFVTIRIAGDIAVRQRPHECDDVLDLVPIEARLRAGLLASPQWDHMVVVITFDENGGWWDHVAPPKGDRWGPGTRVPAIIVSPFARRHFVDHTQYDTASTRRLITEVFGLPELPGLATRDAALVANGEPPMGDMSAALDLVPTGDGGAPTPPPSTALGCLRLRRSRSRASAASRAGVVAARKLCA